MLVTLVLAVLGLVGIVKQMAEDELGYRETHADVAGCFGEATRPYF